MKTLRTPIHAGILLLVFVATSRAGLLVYEGFNYPVVPGTGTVHGQTGGVGFALGSRWTVINSGSYPQGSPTGFAICNSATGTLWKGTVTSVPQTGNFAGSPAPANISGSGLNGSNPDHMMAQRLLDPSVTAKFTLGAVTWMSYVEASNHSSSSNGTGGSFAIGQATLYIVGADNRG